MKKFCITLFCLSIILLTIVLGVNTPEAKEEYLRIHIRARSNSAEDQAVKYAVRDEVVCYLTPIVAACKTKDELKKALSSGLDKIKEVADEALSSNGLTYSAEAKLCVEEFPVRKYGDLTLEAGFYDALIIELGGGEGDNWWCVVYPPLCFMGKGEGDFRYASKIVEMIEIWRDRYGK